MTRASDSQTTVRPGAGAGTPAPAGPAPAPGSAAGGLPAGASPPGSLGLVLKVGAVAAAAAAVGLATSAALPYEMAGAAALTVFCIGLWASALVPEYWTAFAFFLIASLAHVAPPEAIFAGFQSSTLWMLFSGLVIGAAIRHTGLGRRAAIRLAALLGRRYPRIVAGIVLFSLALAFIMPATMGRIMLLLPIVMALAEHMGYPPGANARIALPLAAAFGTFVPAFSILPANVPNMMLSGMAETLYGFRPAYGDYLLLHFPVLGVLKAAVLIVVILKLFPDHDALAEPTDETPPPMSAPERRLAGLLALCLLLWITDAVHHVSPAWIGLAAALVCLWPRAGLTSKTCLNEDINYGSMFFVAGIMGLGAVISATGLGGAVVEQLTSVAGFTPGATTWNVAAITAVSTLVATVTNLPGVPAVMTPVAGDIAAATGLPLATVLMTQVLAFSNVLLPHQAPPIVTAMQVAHLPPRAVIRLCLVMFAITTAVLIPLDFGWWYLLGML